LAAGAWRDSEGFPLRLFLGVMSFGVDKWPIMQVVVHNVTGKMQIILTDLHLSALKQGKSHRYRHGLKKVIG
jgi:hypothetical protein